MRSSATLPAISAARLSRLALARVVDLRSPREFAEDHVPGAINLPLFDDAERALIGTLYVKHSPGEAFASARNVARARIDRLAREIGAVADWRVPEDDLRARLDRMTAGGLDEFSRSLATERVEEANENAVVFNCWRGGLRSRSVAAFVRELGLDRAHVLEGGYKAYRREVVAAIDAWNAPHVFVLRGLTGVGKTLVLRELERRRPGSTVDLERAADHRSSILGMVGRSPRSQKGFESSLARELRANAGGVAVLEGESRKVGDVIIPERLWRALDSGTNLEIVAPLERRVDVLIDDYLSSEEQRAELARQLPFVEARLGSRKWAGILVAMLAARRDRELARLLLEHYYDPLYRHSEKHRRYAARFEASDVGRAAAEIEEWIDEQLAARASSGAIREQPNPA